MEKYYLTKVVATNVAADIEQRTKLVEIQYARQPPSFGVVYLAHGQQDADDEKIDERSAKNGNSNSVRYSALSLLALELRGDKNAAHFNTIRKLRLDCDADNKPLPDVVDFDTHRTIELDAIADDAAPQVVLLCADSSLFVAHLTTGGVAVGANKLTSGCDRAQFARQGLPLQCRLQQERDPQMDGGSAVSFVQVLHEKRYSLYKLPSLSAAKLQQTQPLELISEYLLPDKETPFLRLIRLHSVDVNLSIVILELSDLTLRVVQRGHLLANFNLSETLQPPPRPANLLHHHNQHLVLTCGSNTEEFLLISLSQKQLVAHSLQVTEEANRALKQADDPDNLLEREPSFELDRCWALDLADIDSIRSLDEDQGSVDSAMCPMWSASQFNPDSCWPKYLVIAHGSHLLIYSFAQPPTLPFSVVYDLSFLKVTPFNEDPKLRADDGAENEYIDVRTRPKLIHNFKLTGNQRADSLFNSLFANQDRWQRCSFSKCRHFNQLGLLIGLTNKTDVIAFKIISPKVVSHRDNVYQQLICNSLKEDSLLVNLSKRLQKENDRLLADIDKMESMDFKQLAINLDSLLSVELRPREQLGCLYDIIMKISTNLVQVSRIIVISTVTSFILEPQLGYHSVLAASIYNGDADTQTNKNHEKAFVLSNIQHDGQSINLEEMLRKDHLDGEPILSWAVLDLDSQSARSLCLPIFLMNGQFGHLRVFFQLENPAHLQMASIVSQSQLISMQSSIKTAPRCFVKSIDIKPLMTYRLLPAINKGDLLIEVKITGSFDEGTMALWLAECFDIPELKLEANFKSTFTYCSLGFSISRNRVLLISDDLIALEQLKKHLLKRATDSSSKLDILQPALSMKHLRNLIELQYSNVEAAGKLYEHSKQLENDSRSADRAEALLECLMGEVLSPGTLPVDLEAPSSEWFQNKFAKDLNQLLKTQVIQSKMVEEEKCDDEGAIFKDIVLGFIIDVLVDYDRLHGLKSSNELMLRMRQKMAQVVESGSRRGGGDYLGDKSQFVERVLGEWRECRNDCFMK